jgi:membrane protease YdiL (CAAX protease family)
MKIEDYKVTSKWYYTLARVLLFYFCTVILLIFLSVFTKNVSPKIADQLSILSAAVLTLLLIVIFTLWEKLSLHDVGIIPGKKSIPRFFAGYAIGLLMAVAQALIVLSFGHLQLTLVPKIKMMEIVLPLLLYLLIACREELVFRSYALRSLNYSIGTALALTIITTIFILEHVASGMSWKMAIIGSGTGGILFGMAALKTKGLALPMGLHSAWNFGQWSLGFKNTPGIWKAIVEKGYELKTENIGLAAFIFVMALTIAGVFIFYKRDGLI